MQILEDKGLKCFKSAMERNAWRIIRNIKVRAGFKLLKVKVPRKFLATEGFSFRRDARYMFRNSYLRGKVCHQISYS